MAGPGERRAAGTPGMPPTQRRQPSVVTPKPAGRRPLPAAVARPWVGNLRVERTGDLGAVQACRERFGFRGRKALKMKTSVLKVQSLS